jgi:predicted ATP-dependent protease
MLRQDVIKAIETGTFHVYAMDTIDEGIEILTGMKAGKQLDDGTFEEDSVNARVDKKLAHFAEQIKDYLETGDEKE